MTRPDGTPLTTDAARTKDTDPAEVTGLAADAVLAANTGGTVAASTETLTPAATAAALTKRIDSPR